MSIRPFRTGRRPSRLVVVCALTVIAAGSALAVVESLSGDSLSGVSMDRAGSDAAGAPPAGQLSRSGPEAPRAAWSEEASAQAGEESGLGGLALPAAAGARVVKEASLSVEVGRGRLAGAHRRAIELIPVGGFVQSSNLEKQLVGLVVRVPAAELDSFVARLGGLGEVVGQSISGEDVTAEFVDLEARLRHWRAQEAVFLALMSKAATIGETIEVQRQLSMVQEQVEQLEGRRRLLEDRSVMSTVRLTVAEPGVAARAESPPALAAAWDRAWAAALAVVSGMLVVTGALLPVAALALLVGLIARPLLRRRPRPAGTP